MNQGFETTDWMPYLALLGALLALAFAFLLSRRVLKQNEGTDAMKKISWAIRRGADAYLKRQYTGVGIFFAVVFVVLWILVFTANLQPIVPIGFITGGFFAGLSGFIGMKMATASNARTAHAAGKSLNRGLRIAFSAGAVMGFTVVGLGLFFIAAWYIILKLNGLDDLQITSAMLTFGMGISFMALFARVGGGIFTKAADVGADLVGKVEVGIPEDDPRNPAVIADNVGDNVGDVAGMGADLYESYVGSIIAASALAVAANFGSKGVMLPMMMAAIGILVSIFGTFFVRAKEGATQKHLLYAMRKGTWISAILMALTAWPLIWMQFPDHKGLFIAVLSGLLAGVLIGFFTEYYTSDHYKPTKKLAGSSKTGSGTLIISGLSLGMLSTAVPVIVIGVSVLVSFYVSGGAENGNVGLFGIALSAVAMLSTLGITLATDAYGPIADNAGGIAEMAQLGPEVRERTDALDSLGNTTAATGKGFAIGSAALTALALIASYIEQIRTAKPDFVFNLNVTNPSVLVGLLVGGMLTFLFAALTMESVGRAAQSIVVEVRRQFKSIKGLMEGKAEPDYEACVDLCAKSAQREMLLPSIITIIAPLVIGFVMGPDGVAGMLIGATVTGFILAIMMSNAGGAWDNAKKYIESGNLGGKGSEAHKASVVGDTVGDPFKDTSGPAINIMIKLLSMVAIVFANLTLAFYLIK